MWKAIEFFAKKVTTSITIDWFIANIVEWITLSFILLSMLDEEGAKEFETRNWRRETREWPLHCCEKMLKFIFVIKSHFHRRWTMHTFFHDGFTKQTVADSPFHFIEKLSTSEGGVHVQCPYCQNQFITINNWT